MTIAIIVVVCIVLLAVVVCIVLLALGFLVPRLSRHPQKGVDSALGAGQRTGGKAPGFLGRKGRSKIGG